MSVILLVPVALFAWLIIDTNKRAAREHKERVDRLKVNIKEREESEAFWTALAAENRKLREERAREVLETIREYPPTLNTLQALMLIGKDYCGISEIMDRFLAIQRGNGRLFDHNKGLAIELTQSDIASLCGEIAKEIASSGLEASDVRRELDWAQQADAARLHFEQTGNLNWKADPL